MLELVDTHCHIQSIGLSVGDEGTRKMWFKAPNLTADGVVKNAVAAGVSKLICVGCDFIDSRQAIDFAAKHENCWATVGIHPHEAKRYVGNSTELKSFSLMAEEPEVVAVGECGLDYYYEHSAKVDQRKILKYQIELAKHLQKPLIFHVREAYQDFWPIFDSYKGLRGVLHSFTDSRANMQMALDRGLYIGVNGIATFAKDDKLLDVYREVPIESLLLETDSPFLTPKPFRGTINEPNRVGTIADFLADIRGESLEDLAASTTKNAISLFGLKR